MHSVFFGTKPNPTMSDLDPTPVSELTVLGFTGGGTGAGFGWTRFQIRTQGLDGYFFHNFFIIVKK